MVEKKNRLGEVEISMAEVKKDVSYIKRDVDEIKTKLDTLISRSSNYVHKAHCTNIHKVQTNDIENLKKEIREIQINWAKVTGVVLVVMFFIQMVVFNFDKIMLMFGG